MSYSTPSIARDGTGSGVFTVYAQIIQTPSIAFGVSTTVENRAGSAMLYTRLPARSASGHVKDVRSVGCGGTVVARLR